METQQPLLFCVKQYQLTTVKTVETLQPFPSNIQNNVVNLNYDSKSLVKQNILHTFSSSLMNSANAAKASPLSSIIISKRERSIKNMITFHQGF